MARKKSKPKTKPEPYYDAFDEEQESESSEPEEEKKPKVKPKTSAANTKMHFTMAKARSADEALSIGATYTRELRASLNASDKAKFTKLATESLENKFKIVDLSKLNQSDKFLQESFDFTLLIEECRRRLATYGLIDVFRIPETFPEDENGDIIDAPDMSNTDDLLAKYTVIKLENIRNWTRFCFQYADPLTIENLQLSQRMLMNSCETELYAKVNGELSGIDTMEQSGPVVFYLITRHVIPLTEKSYRTFLQHLSKLRVTTFPGEDVTRYVSIFRCAARLLAAADREPHDIREMVYDGLKGCSVYQFRFALQTLWTVGSSKFGTYESILNWSQTEYQNAIIRNEWLPYKKKPSSFVATDDAGRGKGGGRGRGKGGGRGNGKGEGRGENTPKQVDRTPPKAGEPHTRKNAAGYDEHWCGKCRDGGRWGNHLPEGHDKWVAEWQEKIKKKKAAAKAKEEAAANTASSTDANATPDPSSTEVNEETRARLRLNRGAAHLASRF